MVGEQNATAHVFVPPAPDPEQYLKEWEERFGEPLKGPWGTKAVVRILCRCEACMTYPAPKGSGAWNEGGSGWKFVDNGWRRY